MAKKFEIPATNVRYLRAFIEVPDDWSVEDLRTFYENDEAKMLTAFKLQETIWELDWDYTEEAEIGTRVDMVIEPRIEDHD